MRALNSCWIRIDRGSIGRGLWVLALVTAAVRASAQTSPIDSLDEAQVTASRTYQSDTMSRATLRPGVRMRLTRSNPLAYVPKITEGRLLEVYVGRLTQVRSDSVILESHNRFRMAIARPEIVRADTSAGRKSRVWGALRGAPLGFGLGAVVGVGMGGGWAVGGMAVLMTPPGMLIGALSGGGEKWQRVDLNTFSVNQATNRDFREGSQ